MTLASPDNVISYSANGVQTVFPVPFYFLDDADLYVYTITAANVPTLKAITTDYTVSGAGDQAGGDVTFLVAPAAGLTVRIYRFAPFTQGTDYVENDPFPAETHERAIDKLTMLCQQLAQRTGGTTFSIDATEHLALSTNDIGVWDGLGREATNFADPTENDSLATKQFVTDQISGAGNVPAPILAEVGKFLEATGVGTFAWGDPPSALVPTPADPADNGKHISASAGAYILRTAAQSRTDLGLGTAAVLTAGTAALNAVQLDALAKLPAVNGSQLTNLPGQNPAQNAHVIIKDVKASATEGGTFTSGAWQTRTLNTEEADTGGLATLAANQITLAAGTYRANIICPAYRCDRNQARLRNITDATTLLVGTSGDLKSGERDSSYSHIVGIFTLAAPKVLEVQHQCSNTRATDGFGKAAGFGENEIYTVVELVKLA